MIIIMRMGASQQEIADVLHKIETEGFRSHPIYGVERTVIGVIGDDRAKRPDAYERMPGVERVDRILRPFKLAGREFHPDDSVIQLNGHVIGGPEVVIMAGPCSVESREQIMEAAHAVKEAGATVLRGGAFKPRTSPYSFQGLGEYGLQLLKEASQATGLPVITEVLSTRDAPLVAQYADILQIGTRNMQNFALLTAVGGSGRPVLLKRGMSNTIEELLMAAEYILAAGNPRVMLCERGIRTFEPATRFTLDLNAVPLLKQLSHLPVVVDPSQATGKWDLVPAMSKAAVAAGADGLLIEVHPNPSEALSDAAQQLKPDTFAQLMQDLKALAPAVGRTV
ncbi:MAG: 3-deoxy-7-phosphoheptulonate synthase [Anaerolineae bacterium]